MIAIPEELAETDVAVIVPVYRNAATLAELSSQVAAALDDAGHRWRLVFVVDASPDDSWEVVSSLAAADPRIGGLHLAVNHGQHRAILYGLRAVRARYVAVMDADLQDPPELLPALVIACQQTGVTVYGQRQGHYQNYMRMLTSRLFKSFLGMLIDLPANVGTFFVVPAAVAMRMACAPLRKVQVVVMARFFSTGWHGVSYQRAQRKQGTSAYSSLGRLQSALRSLACACECRHTLWTSSSKDDVADVVARVNL